MRCLPRAAAFARMAAVLVVGLSAAALAAEKRYAPGITDTEIKIGQTMPYSGAASAWAPTAWRRSRISTCSMTRAA